MVLPLMLASCDQTGDYTEVGSEEFNDVKTELVAKMIGEHDISSYHIESAITYESSYDLTSIGGEVVTTGGTLSATTEATMVDGKSISNTSFATDTGSMVYTTLWSSAENAYVTLVDINTEELVDESLPMTIPAMDRKIKLDETTAASAGISFTTYESVDELAEDAIEASGTKSLVSNLETEGAEFSLYTNSAGDYRINAGFSEEDEGGSHTANYEYYVNSDGLITSATEIATETGEINYQTEDGTLHEVPATMTVNSSLNASYNVGVSAARSNFDEYSSSATDAETVQMALIVIAWSIMSAV